MKNNDPRRTRHGSTAGRRRSPDGVFTRYTVYEEATDRLVILDGTASECAAAMGVAVGTFYGYLCKSRAGRYKWHIDKRYYDARKTSFRAQCRHYSVALRESGVTVAPCGTAAECAAAMGIKLSSFYAILDKIQERGGMTCGWPKKWDIKVID